MKKTKNFSQKYISIRTQFARISFPSLEFSQCWSTIGGIPYGNPAGGAKQQEGGNEKSGRKGERSTETRRRLSQPFRGKRRIWNEDKTKQNEGKQRWPEGGRNGNRKRKRRKRSGKKTRGNESEKRTEIEVEQWTRNKGREETKRKRERNKWWGKRESGATRKGTNGSERRVTSCSSEARTWRAVGLTLNDSTSQWT